MRRRSKRTRLRPGPLILLGLAINIVAGILYSPVTAVRKVRVEGAPKADEIRLTELLQSLRGVPCARVNPRMVESKALENPELQNATLARTPFGSAVLYVSRRIPVAQLQGVRAGLTLEGVLYPASELPEGLPTIELPPGYPSVGLTLGNGWPIMDVARLATLVRELPAKSPVRIRLVDGGRVCLNIDTGTVVLGDTKGVEAKIAWIDKTLRERPNLFDTVLSINLVDIDAPAYSPRKEVPKP